MLVCNDLHVRLDQSDFDFSVHHQCSFVVGGRIPWRRSFCLDYLDHVLEITPDGDALPLLKGVKAMLDPLGIMNPGVLGLGATPW